MDENFESKLRMRGYKLSQAPGDYVVLEMSRSDVSRRAADLGINVERCDGGNVLVASRSFRTPATLLNVHFAASGNLLILEAECPIHGTIHFGGEQSVAVIGGSQAVLNLSVSLYDNDYFEWGERSTAYGARAWVHGGRRCTVGAGCLFSEQVHLRTSDHHAIVDLRTANVVAHPADVKVEGHVWIGEGVSILKGSHIGRGSIVGARSLVTKIIGEAELWAGSPAELLRRDVSWTHSWKPSQDEIASLIDQFPLGPSRVQRSGLMKFASRILPKGSRGPK